MKKIFFTLLFLFLFAGVDAQKKINHAETFNDAYQSLQSNDYAEALYNFNLLKQNGYGNSDISYLCGLCLLNMPERSEAAINEFEEAIKTHHLLTDREMLKIPPLPRRLFFISHRATGSMDNWIKQRVY